ncbi:MAG TPA: GNAT family N-acetyltransferase [Iamia sp.]|nr:GNAT family N-acetyltransferase [Iamia sp.]
MTPGPAPIATPLGLLARRPRTDDDTGLLRALFAASRRDELTLMGWGAEEQQSFVDLQLRAREQHRQTTRPGATLGILTLDDVPVGQLDLDHTEAGIEIVEIAVVPGLQGHGLGTAVLTQVLAEADLADVPVHLNVEVANSGARRLYERLGFVETGPVGPLHLGMERPPSSGATASPDAPGPGDADAPEPAPGADLSGIPAYADLAENVGITVACDDGPDLELVSVDARLRRSPSGLVPYSAVLAGPLDQPLEQGIHRLDLPGTGPVELFIVPIVPEAGRARYELIVT